MAYYAIGGFPPQQLPFRKKTKEWRRKCVQFGDDHLLQILDTMHFDNARQLIEYMREAVEKHRNGASPNDDLTMMELKFDKTDE